ncbi:hypothetical protein AAMO2058_001392300, partial [Amorphochlora amoebiformis]
MMMAMCVRRCGGVSRVIPRDFRRFFAGVNMELLKKLRGVSGAPIKDCKKALEETDGDMDEALEWMRKQGTLVRGKRASQDATQGLVGVAFEGDDSAALVEVTSETDSAVRIEIFHNLLSGVAHSLLSTPSDDNVTSLNTSQLEELKWNSGSKGAHSTVKDAVADAVLQIRENIFPKRAIRLSVPGGVIGGYVHNVLKTDIPEVKMGQIGVLVAVEGASEGKKPEAKELAHKIAMHVAAAKPEYLSSDVIPTEKRIAQEDLL